jgi:hypothetical protein
LTEKFCLITVSKHAAEQQEGSKMTSTVDFIANMQTEVEAMQNKISEMEKRKTDIESEISEFRSEIMRRNNLLLVWEGKADVQPKVKRVVRRGGVTMKSAIVEILGSSHQALNASEVLAGLVSRNVTGSAKNPLGSVRNALQILKKQGQVKSAGFGLYRRVDNQS